MKCKRCNQKIAKGDIVCSNCGDKVRDNDLDNTNTIEIDKVLKEDVKELFSQKDMEKKEGSVNWFLTFIIIVLTGFIIYLFLFDNTLIKRESKQVIDTNNNVVNTVSYHNITFDIDNNIKVSYRDDKVVLFKEGIVISLYITDERLEDIISDINEIILKWNEQGLEISSNKEIDNNIYELIGTYKYNDYLIYLVKLEDKTIVIESSFYTTDKFNSEKSTIENIINSIKTDNSVDNSIMMYPEFNLNPIGSQ